MIVKMCLIIITANGGNMTSGGLRARLCQPLQNFMRGRRFQANTAPAIGYIACWALAFIMELLIFLFQDSLYKVFDVFHRTLRIPMTLLARNIQNGFCLFLFCWPEES